MNKTEFVTKYAEVAGHTKKEAEKCYNAFIEVFTQGLAEDGEVNLAGFVKATKVHKEATTARNPKTGEEVQVPAKNVVKLKVLKGLKDSVNQ